MESDGTWTPEELRTLIAFHIRYGGVSQDIECCAWCHKQKPSADFSPVAVTVNEETGIVEEEKLVCSECIEKSSSE